MQKKILRCFARVACRHPRTILMIALLLTVLSWLPPIVSYFRGGLHAPFDISRMLPQDIRASRDFTRAVTAFDSVDEAVVVFHLGNADEREPKQEDLAKHPELNTPEACEARRKAREKHVELAGKIADRVVELALQNEEIQGAFCRLFRTEDKDYLLYDALPSFGLLLVGDSEIDRVKELLRPEEVRKSVKALKFKLGGTVSAIGNMDELLVLDAIGLGTIFQRAVERYGVKVEAGKSGGGYLVDKNRTMLLAVIQPDRPAQSLDFSNRLCEEIRKIADQACRELLPEESAQYITVEFGGGYEAATRYTSHVNYNLITSFIPSLLSILVLFGLIFRRYSVLFYIGLPLMMVVSWTIGVGWILFGQLNIISASFAAVVVTLSIDYAIHLYNRYITERNRGVDFEEAFQLAMESTGWGIIIGMLTTVAGFFALMATRFTQMAEFGILAGMGITFSAPAMIFVLPALLSWRHRENAENQAHLKPSGLYLVQVGRWVGRHPGIALAIGGVLVAVCAVRLIVWPDSLVFDERISSLRPPERVFELGGEIARAFSNRNPNSLMLINYGSTESDAVEKASQLGAICKLMEKESFTSRTGKQAPLLVAYETFVRFLPPPSEQRRMLAGLREANIPQALETFRQALADEGLDEDFFGFTIYLLERHQELVEKDKVVLPSDLRDTPLWRYVKRFVTQQRRTIDLREELPGDLVFPVKVATPGIARNEEVKASAGDLLTREQILALYHNPDLKWQEQVKRITVYEPSGWVVKTSIYPPLDESTRAGDPLVDDIWLKTAQDKLGIMFDEQGESGSVILTGVPLLAHELANVVKIDFRRVSVAVFVICTFVLLVFFIRNPMRAIYSLVPITLGIIYLFGFMSFSGINFNFVNILVLPIIIGLGVDNGIHLTCHFFESGKNTSLIVAETGRALVVTAVTSVAGFGSLALSSYEGIASMGRLISYALMWFLFASLLVMPAFLFYASRIFKDTEGDAKKGQAETSKPLATGDEQTR